MNGGRRREQRSVRAVDAIDLDAHCRSREARAALGLDHGVGSEIGAPVHDDVCRRGVSHYPAAPDGDRSECVAAAGQMYRRRGADDEIAVCTLVQRDLTAIRNVDIRRTGRTNGYRRKRREHGQRQWCEQCAGDRAFIRQRVVVHVAAGDRRLIEVDRRRGELVARRRGDGAIERQRQLAEHRAGRGVVHDHVAGDHHRRLIDLNAVLRQKNGVADAGRDLLGKYRGRANERCEQKQKTMFHRHDLRITCLESPEK